MDEEEVLSPDPITPSEFAKKIKAKYPQYQDVDDTVLAQKIIDKYPQYKEQVDFNLKKKDPSKVYTTNVTSTDGPSATEEPQEKSTLEKGVDLAKVLFKHRLNQGADAFQHLKAGASETVAGLAGIPNLISKSMVTAFASDEDLEYLNSLPEDQRETFVGNMVMGPNPISGVTLASQDAQNYMTNLSEELSAKTVQYEGNILDDISKGRLDQAAARIANGTAESIPSLLMAAAPGGIVAIGAGSAAQKQEQLEREGDDLDSNSILNSWVSGAAEGVFEGTTAKLLKPLKGVFKGNRGMADKFSNSFVKETLKSMGLEGSSEAATTITHQLSDNLFRDESIEVTSSQFWKNVGDAALIGGIVGGGISVTTLGANRVMSPETKKKVSDIQEQTEIIDGELSKALPEPVIKELQAAKETLEQEKATIEQSEYDKFKSLSPEKRAQLGETESQIDKLKAEYDAINQNENLDPVAKRILLEKKSAQAEELLKSKQEILNAKEETPATQEAEQKVLPEQAQENQEVDETAQVQNTDADGNVQPTTGPISDTTADQEVQTAVEPTTSEATTEINAPKTYKLSESDRAPEYNVKFDEGVLNITDPKGKEPSSKTKRKVMEKYADDFDFTQGERAVIPEGFDGNVNEFVANNSKNPLEIAQLLNDTNTQQFIENQVGFKTRIIADAIQGRIERSSYADTFGDRNNIGINMAKSYFAKKGEGQSIDIIAQELTEDHGIEVTPQDIVDHMEQYQGGKNDVFKGVRDEFINPLKDAFTRTTGLPATNKFITKAIENQRSTDQDYQLADIYTDQELLNLLNEREQATEESTTATQQTTVSNEGGVESQGGRQNEGGSGIQEQSGSDGRGQETATGQVTIPERSTQKVIGGQTSQNQRMARIANGLERGGQTDTGTLQGARPKKKSQEESIVSYAKENDLITTEETILEESRERFPSGKESKVFLSNDGKSVKKIIDYSVYSKDPADFINNRVFAYNELFPETALNIEGVVETEKGISFVVSQPFIKGSLLSTKMISPKSMQEQQNRVNQFFKETFGMDPIGLDAVGNNQYSVQDLHSKNIIEDSDGNLYVIDAITSKKSESSIIGKESNKISKEDKKILSSIEKKLDQWEKDLKKFGDETFGINIPIAIARTAIQAMKAAIKAGKTLQQVIETGIDTIQKTNWYSKLSKTEKEEINPSSLMDSLKKSVDENNAITNDEAKKRTDEAFKKSREKLENKKPFKQTLKKTVRGIIKRFTDRQFISKKLMDGIGAQPIKDLMINSHGMSGKAKRIFDDAYTKIYGKLNNADRDSLDEIIQLRRFITIDKNRFDKGLPQVLHPDFIDADTAQKSLDQYKEEMGDKKFNDLNKRADEYFKVYRDLLKAMRKNGLISQELFDTLDGLDYQPRLFLQHITDFEGSVSLGDAVREKSDTGGLSQDQIKAIDEGSEGSLVTNSEWLLSTSLVSRLRAMAMNNINREFITKEYPKAKKRYENLKDQKDLTREELRFKEYFEELSSKIKEGPLDRTPKNFKKAYWYDDGVRKEFYIEDELHESWFNNTKGFMDPKSKEFISYVSGSALLKGIATGNNPAFAIVNTPRDFLFTSIFSPEYSDFVPKAMLQVAKDAYKGVKEIKSSKKDATGENLFNKYIEYGGDMAFLSTQGRLKKNTMLAQAFDKMLEKRSRDRFKNVFSAITLRDFSTYSEIMFRMALFQRSIKNELKTRGFDSIQDVDDQGIVDEIYNHSVANARSLLDFNQGGSITKDIEAIVPYINTALQGSRVATDAFIKDPTTTTMRVLQAGVLGTSFTIGLALTVISLLKDDEDEDKSAVDIYLDAMEGISPYQKMQYFNIPTGQKNADGEYRVLKVAKTHQMIPVFQFTDNMANNVLMKVSGREAKSMKQIGGEVFDAFNTNISPVSLNSPEQTITRNPIMKSILTYATGYDFYRDQPLAYNVNKDPKPLEGQTMKNVEDFYKKLGREHNLSPVRVKGAVESFLTTPNTNPFIGILYGGADAISSDKDLEKIGKEFTKNLFKSTGRRVVSYTSDFNRSLYKMRRFKDQEEQMRIDEGFDLLDQKDLVKKFTNGDISQDEFMDGLNDFTPFEKKKIVDRFKDYKRLELIVDRNIIDIKYGGTAKLRALMIINRYGDIFDGSEESNKALRQMKIAKGILTDEVLYEYQKLKNEVGQD